MTLLRRFLAPTILATALALTGGCSSGSSKSKAATTTTAAHTKGTTTVPGTEGSTVAGATTAPTSSVAPKDPTSAYCVAVKRLNAKGDLTPGIVSQHTGPDRLANAFAELEKLAPADVAKSIKIVANSVEVIANTKATTQAEIEALNAKVATPETMAASNAFVNFTLTQCGVDLSG